MHSSSIKATFIRSRGQLLDAALKHLSEHYYTRLSENEKCFSTKYLGTRNGTLLEGAVAFTQENRTVLVSVTPFDMNTFQQKLKSLNPSHISIPQPDKTWVLFEALIVGMVAFLGLSIWGTLEGGLSMSIFITSIYYTIRVMGAEDLGRQLRQAPNLTLASILPTCKLPANENWLIVGEEIFTQDNALNHMSLLNTCQHSGIGLLVLHQDDTVKVWATPFHNRKSFETKYNAPIAQLMAG